MKGEPTVESRKNQRTFLDYYQIMQMTQDLMMNSNFFAIPLRIGASTIQKLPRYLLVNKLGAVRHTLTPHVDL